MQDVADQDSALTTASLSCHSEDVAYTITGYAAKKLHKISGTGHNSAKPYFQLLSRLCHHPLRQIFSAMDLPFYMLQMP